jgi:hypothetical protein
VRSSSIVLRLCRLGVSRGSSLDGETARESYSKALINEDSDNLSREKFQAESYEEVGKMDREGSGLNDVDLDFNEDGKGRVLLMKNLPWLGTTKYVR